MTFAPPFGLAIDDLARLVGVLGFLTYAATFGALSLGLLTSQHISYFTLNILAALMVLVSLAADFNLASALIQVLWIVIGCVAILLRLLRAKSSRASQGFVSGRE